MKLDFSDATLGCELELGDVDTKIEIPLKLGVWDRHDSSICNSNGTANDPLKILNRYGGEIQVAPTHSVDKLVGRVQKIYDLFPTSNLNFTTNLHVHIRVPGLRDNLKALKQIAKFIQQWGNDIFKLIDPIPKPGSLHYSPKEFRGAMERYRRRVRSHHTIPSEATFNRLMKARTAKEFLNSYAPIDKNGISQWQLVQRAGINLAHLRKNDCIEFRCFTMSYKLELLKYAFKFPKQFLDEVFNDQQVHLRWEGIKFQPFWPYDYKQDKIFQLTNVRHNPRRIAEANYRKLIEQGVISKEDVGWE